MSPPSGATADRLPRLVIGLVAFSIIMEGALYSAIAPLVPLISRDFALSESFVGLVVSGYSGGLVVGSLAGVPIISRFGARNAAICGLTTFALTTAVFAFAANGGVLLAARVAQGLSAGLLWTACTFWLLSVVAANRRGEVLGKTMSYTFIGTVAGPVLGTIAAGVGIAPTYTVVALGCAAGAAWMLTAPPEGRVAVAELTKPPRTKADSETRGVALLAVALVVLAGVLAGLLNTQSPLELNARGLGDVAVGFVFILAALAAIIAGPVVGTFTDRRGAARPSVLGLSAAFLCLVMLASGVSTGWVYAAAVVALLPAIFAFAIPAGALLAGVSDRTRWSLPFALALNAVGWGTGETLGAIAAGLLLETWGAAASAGSAAAVVAGAAVLTWPLARRGRHFPGMTAAVSAD